MKKHTEKVEANGHSFTCETPYPPDMSDHKVAEPKSPKGDGCSLSHSITGGAKAK